MTKISQLSSIGDSLAVNDQFLIRDVDDSGTPNKSVTVSGITRALQLGSAAAPALAFAADKNTGIYSPGADQLAFSTNGTGRLFIDASGNVGVGVANPSFDLTLDKDVNSLATAYVRSLNTGSSAGGRLIAASAVGNLSMAAFSAAHSVWPNTAVIGSDSGFTGGLVINAAGTNPLQFYTNSSERARIDSSGNVGIGTSSPAKKLDVFGVIRGGEASSTSGSLILEGLYSGADVVNTFGAQQSSASTVIGYAVRPRAGAQGYTSTAGNAGFFKAAIEIGAEGPLKVLYSPAATVPIGDVVIMSEAMRVDTSGRLGLGTASPVAILHVNSGAVDEVARFEGTGSPFISLYDTNVRQMYLYAGSTSLDFLVETNKSLTFGTNNTERARIDSSGRLLAGTSTARTNFYNTTLSAKFQVEGASDGNARASSFVYGQSNASGPLLILGKHRADSIGGITVVSANDELGALSFQGSDGTEFVAGAQITALVDGTPGANDMPGRLVFSVTADGASSPTEAMCIKNSRIINIANTPVYADNAAAKTGGLVDGDVYRTSTGDLKIVYT